MSHCQDHSLFRLLLRYHSGLCLSCHFKVFAEFLVRSDLAKCIMPPLAKHPLGWHYIYLRLIVGYLRLVVALMQWRSTKKKVDEGIAFQSITVPSRDKGRNIEVHLHRPEGYDSTKPTPVLVNWHGSVILV